MVGTHERDGDVAMVEQLAKAVAGQTSPPPITIPRAEFRIFGHGIIDIVREKIWNSGARLQQARKMPPETYLVSRHTNEFIVKIRDGFLDVKLKIGETAEGFEIFQPAGKSSFPVKHSDLLPVFKNLGIDLTCDRELFDVEDLIKIARNHFDLVPVVVEKTRYGFDVGDVICEFARVFFNGALMETACCESERYAEIGKAADILGIRSMRNTNYLKAAKRIVGMIEIEERQGAVK